MYWKKPQSYDKGVCWHSVQTPAALLTFAFSLLKGVCLCLFCGVTYVVSTNRFFSRKTVITKSKIHESILQTNNKKPNGQFVQNIGRPIYGIHQSQLRIPLYNATSQRNYCLCPMLYWKTP